MLSKPRRVRRVIAVVVGGLVGGLVLVCVATWFAYPHFSFPEQFRRSKPALNAFAANVTASGSTALARPPSRLGYFKVLKMEPLPHGFLFQSDYGNPFDWLGIAYSTQPLPEYDKDPAGVVKQVFTPIEGDWYEVFRP